MTGRVVVLAALAAAVLGCNMITGADDLVIGDGDDGQGAGNAGSGASAAGGQGTGAGAQGGDGAGGVGQGGGTGAGGPVDTSVAADGVVITDIIVYQGVSRPLMEAGQPASSGTPVVANRDALFRVFYNTDGSYNGQPVTARLTIGQSPPIEVPAQLGSGSSEGDPQSTVNILVPGELMALGGTYRVDLLQPEGTSSGNNAGARYPQAVDAQDGLQTEASGKLRVTLVPVQYNADNSGRLPDTSAAQLQRYEDMFYAMYPISELEIKVRQPVGWNNTISSNGSGWESMLNAIADLRNSDNVAFDEFYYGIFNPTSSFNSYCSGGCVLGLGFVGGPSDEWAHSAIGIGYSGDQSVETAVHELGHNHGRNHAPCGGVAGADGNFPYNGAGIGVYGYNLLDGALYSPSQYKDMMSYCGPAWISDYTYSAIFDRTAFNNNAQSLYVPPALANAQWSRAIVHGDGSMSWMEPITLKRPVMGEAVTVQAQTQGGVEQLSGRYIRYDHIDGGVLFMPQTSQPILQGQWIEAIIDGQTLSLQKTP